jgi:hypothetical protein
LNPRPPAYETSALNQLSYLTTAGLPVIRATGPGLLALSVLERDHFFFLKSASRALRATCLSSFSTAPSRYTKYVQKFAFSLSGS